MTPAASHEYSPVAPPRNVRRLELFRQALRLPNTLLAIHAIIRENYAAPVLDSHLRSFRMFHDRSDDPEWRARRWTKTPLREIAPEQVSGLAVWEFAFMANVARELEEPIFEYSRQNGQGFRYLLPSLARFLGKNQDEGEVSAAHTWCESPWCMEERRHAAAFARIIERLTGSLPSRSNPNRPKVVTASERDAIQLLLSRQSAEWNSSSTYVVMTAHATGQLRQLLREIARDEIKHLAILAAADRYLFGPRPWRRFGELVAHGLDEYRGHKRTRSAGALIGTNRATAFEVIVAHVLAERAIRRWLRTLGLSTLAWVFEAPARSTDAARPDDVARQGRLARESLARWRGPRERYLELRSFERQHARVIDDAIATALDSFRGAETAGSREDRRIRRRIHLRRGRLMRASLLARLRDHQVRSPRTSP